MAALNPNSKLMARPLPVDIMVALYDFQARDHDELTIKEGQLLSLEDSRKTDDWARVRSRVDPDAPSGLVPWSYIEPKKPAFRASALYNFARQKSDEVEMALGQPMSVYGTSGTRFLVKLDDFNGRVGRVGFVPQNYIEAFQAGQKEDLLPMASKALPER
ncbi:cytoskeletal protein binding protein, partial [Tulasnella sp. 408]